MKIFNIENGKAKMYVQFYDISMLTKCHSLTIPYTIVDRFFGDVFVGTGKNRFKFVEFTKSNEIDFFQNADWILDFKAFKACSKKEIENNIDSIKKEMKKIANKYNLETHEVEAMELMDQYKHLEYKIMQLEEIIYFKEGDVNFPFPIVPDYDGFKSTSNNDTLPYVIQQGLNPMQMLLYRIDGKALELKKDMLPRDFIYSANCILINDNFEHYGLFDNFESTINLSDDRKYLVFTFSLEKNEELKDESQIENEKQEEQITLSKKIKNSIAKVFK